MTLSDVFAFVLRWNGVACAVGFAACAVGLVALLWAEHSRGCPCCGKPGRKVIFAGLPGRLCDEECGVLRGPAEWMVRFAPFLVSEDEEGETAWAMMAYEGSYWRALWFWLRGGVAGGDQ